MLPEDSFILFLCKENLAIRELLRALGLKVLLLADPMLASSLTLWDNHIYGSGLSGS